MRLVIWLVTVRGVMEAQRLEERTRKQDVVHQSRSTVLRYEVLRTGAHRQVVEATRSLEEEESGDEAEVEETWGWSIGAVRRSQEVQRRTVGGTDSRGIRRDYQNWEIP